MRPFFFVGMVLCLLLAFLAVASGTAGVLDVTFGASGLSVAAGDTWSLAQERVAQLLTTKTGVTLAIEGGGLIYATATNGTALISFGSGGVGKYPNTQLSECVARDDSILICAGSIGVNVAERDLYLQLVDQSTGDSRNAGLYPVRIDYSGAEDRFNVLSDYGTSTILASGNVDTGALQIAYFGLFDRASGALIRNFTDDLVDLTMRPVDVAVTSLLVLGDGSFLAAFSASAPGYFAGLVVKYDAMFTRAQDFVPLVFDALKARFFGLTRDLSGSSFLVTGSVQSSGSRWLLVRFDSQGTIMSQANFLATEDNAGVNVKARQIALQPDGKFLLSGQLDINPSATEQTSGAGVFRCNASGILDPSFGNGGRFVYNLSYSRPDGQGMPSIDNGFQGTYISFFPSGAIGAFWIEAGMATVARITNDIVSPSACNVGFSCICSGSVCVSQGNTFISANVSVPASQKISVSGNLLIAPTGVLKLALAATVLVTGCTQAAGMHLEVSVPAQPQAGTTVLVTSGNSIEGQFQTVEFIGLALMDVCDVQPSIWYGPNTISVLFQAPPGCGGLTAGQIVGIIVGSVMAGLIVALIAVFVTRYKQAAWTKKADAEIRERNLQMGQV